MTRSCATCEFSQPIEGADYGECRRHAPPAMVYFADTSSLASWPRIRPTDWCGDFVELTDKKRRAA